MLSSADLQILDWALIANETIEDYRANKEGIFFKLVLKRLMSS